MTRLQVLVRGELDRLNKYNLFSATFVVLLVWVGIAWFLEGEYLRLFVPMIFLIDTTVMTILLTGALLFYEKHEHTMNSIMVSPVTEDEYLMAKVIVNVFNSMFTLIFVSAVLYVVKQVTFNYLLLVPAVILVSAVHTLIGVRLSYHAKTFTAVLVNLIVYALLFLTPSILLALGVIPEAAADYLLVLPPEASSILISAAVTEVETWRLLTGFGYLILLAYVLYRFLIKPTFNDYVMRETGV